MRQPASGFKAIWRKFLSHRRMKFIPPAVAAAGIILMVRSWQVMSVREKLRTPLVIAAEAGDYPKVEALLKQGADPNSRQLVEVSIKDRIEGWLDSLGQPKDQVPEQDDFDWVTNLPTALTVAAACEHTRVVKLLLQYGADVNLRSCGPLGEGGHDPKRCTALELAKMGHYTETVQVLEQAGATD